MIHEHKSSGQQYVHVPRRSRLLEQHPVLTPALLIGSSVGLFIASLSANTLFPFLTFIGVPSALLCLLVASVSGIAGILAGIIYIIERIGSYHLQRLPVEVLPQSKEHSYANRN